MPATGTRTSSSAICGCDSSTWSTPGAPGVRRLSRLRPRLRRRRPPRPSSSSNRFWACWPPWFAAPWPSWPPWRFWLSWRFPSPRSWRSSRVSVRSWRSPRVSPPSWRSVRSVRSWRSVRSCRSLWSCRSWRSCRSVRFSVRSWRSPRSVRSSRAGCSRDSVRGARSSRGVWSGSRRAPVLAGPLSPFWRALMAATRSPLRILAVPLMPMLEARPWSSASRMAVSAPERRGLVPEVASRVVVSVTKDPSPRSWMASIRPIIGSPRRARSAWLEGVPDRGGRLAAGNGRHPASTAVARPRVAPRAAPDAASEQAAPVFGNDPVSRSRAPRRALRAVGCRG